MNEQASKKMVGKWLVNDEHKIMDDLVLGRKTQLS